MNKIIIVMLYLSLVVFGFMFGKHFSSLPQQTLLFADNSNTAVYVRGDRWAILTGNHDALLNIINAYGITDCANKQIYIANSLSKGNLREVVLHELLHAGTCDNKGQTHNLFYNSSSPENHEGIYKIADYISSLLSNNPDLSKFLSGE